jgi:hypothetical protein
MLPGLSGMQFCELLKANLKNKNLTQTQYDAEYLNIKNALLEQNAELTVANAQTELDNYIQANQSKIDNDLFFSDEALRIETERLEGIATKQKEFAEKQLAEGVINRTDYNTAIKEIDDEFTAKDDENRLARKEAQAVADAIDFENRLALNAEHAELNLEQQLEILEAQKLAELENAEATGADKELIEQRYAEQEKEIAQSVSNNKLDLASNTLGSLITILGKESSAGKAVAVAQATIDTYKSAVSAYSAMAGIPVVGPALGAVAAGAAVASGLATVKQITATKKPSIPKAERGRLLSGARHSQGGIHIEAEDGEAIINRNSTSKYLPLLSAINQDGGGVPFMANGGIAGSTSSTSTSIIDYNLLASSIASMPAPIVSVEEISSVSSRVNVIESQSVL